MLVASALHEWWNAEEMVGTERVCTTRDCDLLTQSNDKYDRTDNNG